MDALAHYREAPAREVPGVAPWLDQTRARGREGLARTGFPGRRDEDWKYTNPARLLQSPFAPGQPGRVERLPAEALTGPLCLVLVDGCFAPALSSLGALPEGLSLEPLSAAGEGAAGAVGAVLADPAGFDALNAAFLTDGALIRLAEGAVVERPIHLVHLSTGGDRLHAVRVAVRAGAGSRATVVEHYLGQGPAWTSAVTELDLGPGATLGHVRVQEEAPGTQHLGAVVARQAGESRLDSWVLTLGAGLSRVDLRVALEGEGAEVALHGLYLLRDRQHADHHTHVDHAVPRTRSRERYKGILDGRSRGVFTGRILVRPQAQRIDSAQENHALVLSESAVANSRPQLEIYADDVRCAHGATVGRLDPEALFYLRSRGLGPEAARALLTFAFSHEVIGALPEGALRTALERRVRAWLEAA